MVEMPKLRQYSKSVSWQMDRVYITTSSSNTVGMTGTYMIKAGGINMNYNGNIYLAPNTD